MSERDWKRDYDGLLQRSAPVCAPRRGRSDTRRHPRLQPKGISFWIGGTPGIELIDISPERIDFYSNVKATIGQRLRIQVDTAPPFGVEVVAWHLEETDPRLLEVRYRVRGRILPAVEQS